MSGVQRAKFTEHAVQRLRERFDVDPHEIADLVLGRHPYQHVLNGHRTDTYRIDVPDVMRFVLRKPGPHSVTWVIVTVLPWKDVFDYSSRASYDPRRLRDRMSGKCAPVHSEGE